MYTIMKSSLKDLIVNLRNIYRLIGILPLRELLELSKAFVFSIQNIYLSKINETFCLKKHRIILDYLEGRYGQLVPSELPPEKTINIKNLPIWVFWYQGKAQMPPLVKICYESVKRNACGRPVHLLDKENMHNYVDIPNYIIECAKDGNISMANLSDVLRLLLLAKYGGHWLDATLYVNKPLKEEGLNPYFETIKMPVLQKGTISDYRWATFCLYATPGASTRCSFRDVMLAYFRDGHKRVIDYLLIDYTFQMMYERCTDFRHIIDERPRKNEYTYALVKVLNEPYDPKYFEQWKKQQFFKLNWRVKLKDGDTIFHWLEKNTYINL